MKNSCKKYFSLHISSNRFAWFAKDDKTAEAAEVPEAKAPIGVRDFNHLKKQVEAAKEIVRKKLIEIGREAGIAIPKQALMVFIRQKLLYEGKLKGEVKEKVKVLLDTMDRLDKALEDRKAAEDELRERLTSYGEKINEVIYGFEKHRVEAYEKQKKEWEDKQEKRKWDPMAGFDEMPFEQPALSKKVAFTEREKGSEEEMPEDTSKEAELEMAERIKNATPEVLAQEMFRYVLEGPQVRALDASELNAPSLLLSRFYEYAKTMPKGEVRNLNGFHVYITPSVDGSAVEFKWEGKQNDITIHEHTVVRLSKKASGDPVFKERAESTERLAQKQKADEFLEALDGLIHAEVPAGTRMYVKYKEVRSFPPNNEKREVTVHKMFLKQHMMEGRPDQYRVYTKLIEADGTPVKGHEKYHNDTAYNMSGAQLQQAAREARTDAVISEPRPSKSPQRMAKFMRSAYKKAVEQFTTAGYAMRLFGQRSGPESKPAKDIYAKALNGLSQTIAFYGVEDPAVRKELASAGIELPEPDSSGDVELRVARAGIPAQVLNIRLPTRLPKGVA